MISLKKLLTVIVWRKHIKSKPKADDGSCFNTAIYTVWFGLDMPLQGLNKTQSQIKSKVLQDSDLNTSILNFPSKPKVSLNVKREAE